MITRIRSCVRITSLVLLSAATAEPTMVLRSLTLPETVKQSDRIVLAKTVDVRTGTDENGLPATWVTLEVDRTLKGGATSRFVMKQFGHASASESGFTVRIPDLPRYSAGEEVVVFLRKESDRGFTSPVGLELGVYRVETEDGQRKARSRSAASAAELEGLLAEIESLVAEGR